MLMMPCCSMAAHTNTRDPRTLQTRAVAETTTMKRMAVKMLVGRIPNNEEHPYRTIP